MARPTAKPLDARLSALYATPPEGFTAARKALAADLAAARDPRAAEVKALHRPTLPVWAVNRLAREEPSAVDALLRAGEELVAANRRVLGGSRGGELLEANHALQEALHRAVAAAEERAASAGHALSLAMAARVRTTLRSLALGAAAARGRLAAGRVQTEIASTGLEAFETLGPMRAAPPSPSKTSARSNAPAPAAAARRQTAEERKTARGRERALAAAQKRLRSAEASLTAAEAAAREQRKALEDAQRRASEAAARAREAERHAEDARRQAEEARRALQAAQSPSARAPAQGPATTA
jgi:hypothetical protein